MLPFGLCEAGEHRPRGTDPVAMGNKQIMGKRSSKLLCGLSCVAMTISSHCMNTFRGSTTYESKEVPSLVPRLYAQEHGNEA